MTKGTTLRVLAWYDNSPRNKFNPNPKATVYYGDQMWEEMHFPSYGVVVDDIALDAARRGRARRIRRRRRDAAAT